MGELEQGTASEVTRELSHLRRDVERLSLRLRQETERTTELGNLLEGEQAARAEERERSEAELAQKRQRAHELEGLLQERDGERGRLGLLEREIDALRTELRWARIVSTAGLAVVFLLAIWIVVLVL